MFGLAAGGASGVDSVPRHFQTETVGGVLHSGVDGIARLGGNHVMRVPAT